MFLLSVPYVLILKSSCIAIDKCQRAKILPISARSLICLEISMNDPNLVECRLHINKMSYVNLTVNGDRLGCNLKF